MHKIKIISIDCLCFGSIKSVEKTNLTEACKATKFVVQTIQS